MLKKQKSKKSLDIEIGKKRERLAVYRGFLLGDGSKLRFIKKKLEKHVLKCPN